MIKASELRRGRAVIYEGQIYNVKDMQHVAKGNWRSYINAKLKNLVSGQIIDVRFNTDDRLEVPFVESRAYEYLYPDGEDLVLMDLETFDQVHVSRDLLGDQILLLKPNEQVTCQLHNNVIITVELPNTVELTVADTPPVVKGATATNQPKEATLETGAKVRVPAFIAPGERIRVDTRSGEYIERAK